MCLSCTLSNLSFTSIPINKFYILKINVKSGSAQLILLKDRIFMVFFAVNNGRALIHIFLFALQYPITLITYMHKNHESCF